jgi:hypothetical protein
LEQLPSLEHIPKPIVEQKQPRQLVLHRRVSKPQGYVARQSVLVQVQSLEEGEGADLSGEGAGELVVAQVEFCEVGEGGEGGGGQVAGETVLGEDLGGGVGWGQWGGGSRVGSAMGTWVRR